MSDPFMKLPSRREYPDYYEIIKKPIDIKKICSKIENGAVSHLVTIIMVVKNVKCQRYKFVNNKFFSQYADLDDLEKDFMQLCKNAQFYNEDASLIHEDSIVLQSVFTEARKRLETQAEEKEETESGPKGKVLRLKGKIYYINMYHVFIIN